MRRLQRLSRVPAWVLITLLAGVLVGLGAAPALAHGDLVDGSPGPGDALAPGGEQAALRFDELAEDGRALIAILDESGDPVAVGPAQTAADAETVCATTAPLGQGVYTVQYSVTSNDGDLIRGKYTFEVVAEADPTDNQVTDACTHLTLEAPGEAQTLDEMGTGEFPSWLPYLLGVLLLGAVTLVVRRVRHDRTLDDSGADSADG